MVVVSLVRNNRNQDNPTLALGFLQEMERINVMFSRAERLLVLVGCWKFFQAIASELEQGRSLQEWPLIIKYLKQAFAEQKALYIEMDQLLVRPGSNGGGA